MLNYIVKSLPKIAPLLMFLALIQGCQLSAQEPLTASGKVTGKDDGMSIPGVSVKVKGVTTATSTDPDGKFSFKVPTGAILVFSSLGYGSNERPAAAGTNIVLVATTSELQEVTVVGATIKKSDLTGSVSSIGEKVIKEMPVTNINQAIQGRVGAV